MTLGKLMAPWPDEVIEHLDRHQANPKLHPYTCECGHSLIPTKDGWECEECSYTQDWCTMTAARAIVLGLSADRVTPATA